MRLLAVKIICLGAVLAALGSTGCVVPQPRGGGKYMYVEEPSRHAWYHLYLPADYIKHNGIHPKRADGRWPLVLTLHGMKPYDNAKPQEREWEQEADTYGYIVCAPDLETSDSFMEYPLTKEHDYVLRDKDNVLAVMDHIFATTRADPGAVLVTSWSCGGYLAHYFMNRFPARFACLATRLSNFSAELLIESTVDQYRHKPIAMFIGDGDFPKCKSESKEAVAWYTARRFSVVRGKMIDNMGHRRIPQTAAAFFAEHIGLQPLDPAAAAASLAKVNMTEYHPDPQMIARLSPRTMLASRRVPLRRDSTGARRGSGRRDSKRRESRSAGSTRPPLRTATRSKPPPTRRRPDTYLAVNAGRGYPFGVTPAFDPRPAMDRVALSDINGPSRQPAAPGGRAGTPGRPGNWLEPTEKPSSDQNDGPVKPKPSGDTGNKPLVRDASRRVASAESPPNRRALDNNTTRRPSSPVGGRSPSLGSSAGRERSAKAPGDRGSPARDNTRRTPSTFSPRNAGPRAYPMDALASAKPRRRDPTPKPANTTPRPNRSTNPQPPKPRPTPRPAVTASRAKRVNILLGGPAIGSAPYYLAYGVDLPSSVTRGADFLWMDNGVWLGDAARGVRVLDAPGLHRVSVLIITRDNREYRGSATVQVLRGERPATSGTRRAR